MALVLITHDLGVVARVATRVVVMYAGQVVEVGTTAELFADPMHPYTEGLLRCIPIPGRTRRDQPLGSIAGLVPSLIGPQPGCSFANRCDYVQDVCRSGTVPLADDGSGHGSRCLFTPETRRPAAMAAVAS